MERILGLTVALVLSACGDDGGSSGSKDGSNGGDPFGGGDLGPGTMDVPAVVDLLECMTDATCSEGYYCDRPGDAIRGRCEVGCRYDPNTCVEAYLCIDRVCVLESNCSEDLNCAADLYCLDGDCVPGCKAVEPDPCASAADGRPQRCNADTRACEPTVVCCDAANACTYAVAADCSDIVDGVASCVNPNPCENRCESDDDCDETTYCSDAGRCEVGCRPDDRGPCPNGQNCNENTHTCEYRSCATDEECPNAQFCGGELCSPGCRLEPDNCPGDNTCQQNRECGLGCSLDAECVSNNGAGWFCLQGQCNPPCAEHADCPELEVCDAATQRCVAGCREDVNEPNDDLATAAALNFENGTHYDSGVNSRLSACNRNRDFFRFDAPGPGYTIRASIEFEHASGDLDMRLYDAAGSVVARSESADDDESFVFPGDGVDAAGGRYSIEVYARGLDRNTYRLVIDLVAPGVCLEDEAEVGPGDESALSATRLPLAQLMQSQTVADRTLCASDVDWFSVRMGNRDGLTVRLDVRGDADLSFELFGPQVPGPNTPPAFEPNGFNMGPNGARTVEFSIPRFNAGIFDGTYYVRVFETTGSADAPAGDYDLTVAVDRERALCIDDEAEPNDVRPDAFDLMVLPGFTRMRIDGVGTELVPGMDLRLPGLWLCGGESDWYSVVLTDNDTLDAFIDRSDAPAVGDTRVEILNAQGQRVGLQGRSSEPRNAARAANLPAGTYFVAVTSIGDTQAEYQLSVNRTTSPLLCTPDRFDVAGGNELQANATAIGSGRQVNLTLCGLDGDEDWYVVTLDTIADLTLTLDFTFAQGNLDVDIYRDRNGFADNAGQVQGHSNLDDETVVLRNRPAGQYFIRVYGVGFPNVRYDMNVLVEEEVFECNPDEDEPNEDVADATNLGSGIVNGRATQWICEGQPRDEDFFRIEVDANDTRSIVVPFLYGDDGDLYLEIYDSDQMLRGATFAVSRGNSKQCVIVEPTNRDRVFFLHVGPLSINSILEMDQRLDYQMFVIDGDDCDAVGPPSFGLDWPRVVD